MAVGEVECYTVCPKKLRTVYTNAHNTFRKYF